MQLYESNYLRLHELCGDPARLNGERLSQVEQGCALRMRVLERSAYTVTLNLTHLFDAHGAAPTPELATYPDVELRVYCDARLVQAREWAELPPGAPADQPARVGDRELRQRWTYNIMLNKWLDYCLEVGHRLG